MRTHDLKTAWPFGNAVAGDGAGDPPAFPGFAAAEGSRLDRTWDFAADEPGTIARGFKGAVGDWAVAVEGDNRVLVQKAKNDDATFNVALAEGTSYKDLDLSVRLRAVAGEVDRGGGLVWRALDARNYYIARYNPLEDNFRVYKVQDGKRTQFQSAKVPGDEAWHTLQVTMVGPRIVCRLDGKTLLEVEDSTFPNPGHDRPLVQGRRAVVFRRPGGLHDHEPRHVGTSSAGERGFATADKGIRDPR